MKKFNFISYSAAALFIGLLSTGIATTVASAVTQQSGRPATEPVVIKLTNIENAYPDWSPDGSKIVFQCNVTGTFQIYVMNADGTHRVCLTNHPHNDAGPHFSPDGSKIAFDSDRDGNSEIYVMNADGSEQRRLTNHPADDSHPNWSPDGSRIIFDSARDTPDLKADWWAQFHDLYSIKADGTDIRKITDNHTVCTFGSWSPDGKKIAYRKVISTPGFYDNDNLTLSNTNSEVFVADADGKNEINLSRSAAYDAWPAWSRDSKQVFFGSNRGARTQLFVVNVDGSNLRRLLNDADSDEDTRPRMSPDGSKLLFTRARHGTMEIETLALDPRSSTSASQTLLGPM